ncbi:MAG: tRNA adenosine(34) deaminase TadA [Blastocatellia bacterium]|nr:tRNA adenosine(34) deaminase TadA [Blastocatellia bacterium]MCX7751283.1 tRNA adenosine(34) deaminase TadA [Blastocatellia bacterium]MDW8168995.1 tRNA adenosine(34) deaminase TadA [Acidobacteriota bacterium]MDW8256755.1 tRNA adenosine(34) deaminase TadA [Acidobacteriota bacterium]
MDEVWMRLALDEAADAERLGEVPIGAVVVLGEKVIGRGHNRVITEQDPTAHAEIVALRDAARFLNNYRLVGTTLYVTIEPCPMCAGALLNARVARLVYGAADPRAGAVTTLFQLCTDPRLTHRLQVQAGVLEAECREMIQSFFQRKRAEVKREREQE